MDTHDRRTEVLDHARNVIVRDGLATTSLRRICREGGYTTGVLTHYFADKRELIAACFDHTTATWLEGVVEGLADAPTPEASVLAYVDIATPSAATEQDGWRLWLEFCSSAVGDPELSELLLAVDGRWEEATAAALARWREAGLVHFDVPLEQQTIMLVRLVDGLGLRALVTGDWHAARVGFVGTLEILGLPRALAERALRSATAGETR